MTRQRKRRPLRPMLLSKLSLRYEQLERREVLDAVGLAGALSIVSAAADGTVANSESGFDGPASVSADGRYVAFTSGGMNLVAGKTDQKGDVFVKDMTTGSVTLVSAAADGTHSNGHSYNPSISADGRYVAFISDADNLVPNDSSSAPHVFRKDLQTGAIVEADTDAHGVQADGQASSGVSISADGSHVAFVSSATNLGPNQNASVYIKSLSDGGIAQIADHVSKPTLTNAALSSDGSEIVTGGGQIWLTNIEALTSSQLDAAGSTPANGPSERAEITPNGHFVVFESAATNLTTQTVSGNHIYVKDVVHGTMAQADIAEDGTQGNGSAGSVAITADGTSVVFDSFATNLVPGDSGSSASNVFLKKLSSGVVSLVSADANGTPGNEDSSAPTISGDGTHVVFNSNAPNLFTNVTNPSQQVFEKTVSGSSGGGGGGGGGSPTQHDKDVSYVTAVFQEVLGRAPDDAGLAYFTNLLDNSGITPDVLSQVAQEIVKSPEYFAKFVVEPDFQKFLFRSSDSGGLQFFVNELLSGTVTDQDIEAQFLASDEFYNHNSFALKDPNGSSDTDWVKAVYQVLLLRGATDAEVNFWLGQLNQKPEDVLYVDWRRHVAEGFTTSQENQINLVQADYQKYLNRLADSGGLDFWVNELKNGSTLEDLIAGFTGSTESYQKLTTPPPTPQTKTLGDFTGTFSGLDFQVPLVGDVTGSANITKMTLTETDSQLASSDITGTAQIVNPFDPTQTLTPPFSGTLTGTIGSDGVTINGTLTLTVDLTAENLGSKSATVTVQGTLSSDGKSITGDVLKNGQKVGSVNLSAS